MEIDLDQIIEELAKPAARTQKVGCQGRKYMKK